MKNDPPLKSDPANVPKTEALLADESEPVEKTLSNGGSTHVVNDKGAVDNPNGNTEECQHKQNNEVTVEQTNAVISEETVNPAEILNVKDVIVDEKSADKIALIPNSETDISKGAFALNNEIQEETTLDTNGLIIHEKETSSSAVIQTNKS